MRTLSAIKKDVEFNRDLSNLIEILKNIAIAQYKALEHKIKPYDKLKAAISSFLEFIDTDNIAHPFLKPRDKRQIVVAVTSDTGLLGGLNTRVVAAAIRELEGIPGILVVIGERGKAYAGQANIPYAAFAGIRDEERHAQAGQLRDYVIARFLKESIGYLKIIYPRAVSLTVQRVEKMELLPYGLGRKGPAPKHAAGDVIIESRPGDILEYLVYIWIGEIFEEIFGMSRLAEFAARFVHLEDSSQKIKEMDRKMRLQYFKARHELIDRSMRELSAARLLYAAR